MNQSVWPVRNVFCRSMLNSMIEGVRHETNEDLFCIRNGFVRKSDRAQSDLYGLVVERSPILRGQVRFVDGITPP